MPHILLKNTIIKKLAELGYRKPLENNTPSAAWSLKSTLLGGHSDVEIKAQNSFEVTMTTRQFAECLQTDFYYGYERVSKQNSCLTVLLAKTDTPAAWSLVTAYYSAFFAAIEICKLLGRLNTYIDDGETQCIRAQSKSPVRESLKEGNYLGEIHLDKHQGEVKIRFCSSGTRPHLLVWKNLGELFPKDENPSLPSPRRKQILLFKEIITSKNQWSTPSEVRNQWNYTNAHYYGKNGETIANSFRKNAHSKESCYLWAATKRLQPNEESKAVTIAFINTVLFDVIETIKPRLL